MNAHDRSSQPRVVYDARPDRAQTLTGWRFWRALSVSQVLILMVPFTGISWATYQGHVDWLLYGLASWCALVVPGFLLMQAVAYAGDLKRKTPICNRYGCTPRFGADYIQVREIGIENAPPQLGELLIDAVKAIDPNVRITHPSAGRTSEEPFIQAVRRGGRRERNTIIQIRWAVSATRYARVSVESQPYALSIRWFRKRLTKLLNFGPPEGGRSIENVEEFHLNLRRRLGLDADRAETV